MEIEIKAFGIARDILGHSSIEIKIEENTTVEALIQTLENSYPAFSELTSLAIAINATYAEGNQKIKAGDEVVIIPPVAGG